MGLIYYKQVFNSVITFFAVNTVTRNIEGMFKECRTKDLLSIIRVKNMQIWNDIDHNELSKSLIENSVQIPQEEYEAAEFVMNAMIEANYWYVSEDKMEQLVPNKTTEEVIAETVYC